MRKRYPKMLALDGDVKRAIISFMRDYHAREDFAFDCYAFANLVRSIEPHRLRVLRAYWTLKTLSKRPRAGDIVFLLKGHDHFRHAAVYLGSGLYLSVWGGGGDLEVATLKGMMRDFGATKARLATRTSVTT